MVALPPTQYATTEDGLAIAYVTIGEGPVDLLLIPDLVQQLELNWEHPSTRRMLDRLARFCRLIMMDTRGLGLSDPAPVSEMASLELAMEDVRAVIDDVGVEEVSLLGQGHGAQVGMFFAASNPSRCRSLVLMNGYAFLGRTDDNPIGFPVDVQEQIVAKTAQSWGRHDPATVALMAPSAVGDGSVAEWFARVQRYAASPRIGRMLMAASFEIDVRQLASLVAASTLVIHARDDKFARVAHGRWLAEHLPNATYKELDGADHWFWVDDDLLDAVIDEVERFLTGAVEPKEANRVLATVLFSDVVASTDTVVSVGDTRWTGILDTLDHVVGDIVARHRGQFVKHTGDGHLLTFDGPGRAIRCAQAIRDAAAQLGLRLRIGLHAGEVELRKEDVSGIAVHIAARIMALAGPDEILVSGIVPPLVAGSNLTFGNRGTHTLKGVPGEWHVYEVSD